MLYSRVVLFHRRNLPREAKNPVIGPYGIRIVRKEPPDCQIDALSIPGLALRTCLSSCSPAHKDALHTRAQGRFLRIFNPLLRLKRLVLRISSQETCRRSRSSLKEMPEVKSGDQIGAADMWLMVVVQPKL
jgi:hypothetical protein